MKKQNWLIIGFISLLLGFLLLTFTSLKPKNVQIDGQKTYLPVYIKDSTNQAYSVRFEISKNYFTQTKLRLLADNCLESVKVNQKELINQIYSQNGCDIQLHKNLDFKNYLKPGVNQIEVIFTNRDGPGFLLVKPSFLDPKYLTGATLIFLGLLLILYVITVFKLKIPSFIFILLAFSIVLQLIYLSYTPFNLRGHDTDGHIDYVSHLLQNSKIPDAKDCWQCYQPPVYYGLAAILIKLLFFFNPNLDWLSFLQTFSLILFNISLLIGLKLILLYFPVKSNSKNSSFEELDDQSDTNYSSIKAYDIEHKSPFVFSFVQKYLGVLKLSGTKFNFLQGNFLLFFVSSLWIFWPVGFYYSVRIGNDLMLYVWFLASFLAVSIWWQTRKTKMIFLASICAVLALLSKSNGFIMIASILLLLGYVFVFEKNRLNSLKQIMLSITVFAIGLAISLFKALFGKNDDLLVGNAGSLNGLLGVGNRAGNYFWFDIQDFLTVAGTDPWVDRGGRQYFSNFVLKTALFGEYPILQEMSQNVALMLNFLLLIILVFIAILIFNLKKSELLKILPLVTVIGISISSLAFLRYRLPFAPSSDFRYIYPCLIGILIIFGLQGKRLMQTDKFVLQTVFVLTGLLFISLSICWVFLPFLFNDVRF